MHLCQGEALLTGTQDPKECRKQLKKKQKNRAAAQRSRQKHTDRADALHQQHESLEKHNQALRKEIQGLKAELAQWSQTLHLHEHLCPRVCTPGLAPEPPDYWGQARWLLGQLTPQGQHICQEQPGLFQTPVPCLPVQQPHPDPQPQDPCGLLPTPLSLLSLSPAVGTLPPAQMSPSQLGSPSKFSGLLPRPPAQAAPPQPLGQVSPSRGELGSSLGPEYLQSREHKPGPLAADWSGLALDPRHQALKAFPLLASAGSASDLGLESGCPTSGSGSSHHTPASAALLPEWPFLKTDWPTVSLEKGSCG